MLLLRKAGPESDSLLRPPAAIDGLGVGVKRGYGSPPSNSPRLLFVIYKVDVVGVVYCSHTPEESADYKSELMKSGRLPKTLIH